MGLPIDGQVSLRFVACACVWFATVADYQCTQSNIRLEQQQERGRDSDVHEESDDNEENLVSDEEIELVASQAASQPPTASQLPGESVPGGRRGKRPVESSVRLQLLAACA